MSDAWTRAQTHDHFVYFIAHTDSDMDSSFESSRSMKREGVIRINYLLNFTFSDPAFVQILNELLSLHPVDERTHIPAVTEERSAGQVHRAA